MSDTEKKPSPKKASASTEPKATKGVNDTLQAAYDEANAKGYFGTVPDTTPNEDYTVAGVIKKAEGK